MSVRSTGSSPCVRAAARRCPRSPSVHRSVFCQIMRAPPAHSTSSITSYELVVETLLQDGRECGAGEHNEHAESLSRSYRRPGACADETQIVLAGYGAAVLLGSEWI